MSNVQLCKCLNCKSPFNRVLESNIFCSEDCYKEGIKKGLVIPSLVDSDLYAWHFRTISKQGALIIRKNGSAEGWIHSEELEPREEIQESDTIDWSMFAGLYQRMKQDILNKKEQEALSKLSKNEEKEEPEEESLSEQYQRGVKRVTNTRLTVAESD